MSDKGLTYSDVYCILAALDSWPKGRVHLRLGSLDMQAVVGLAPPAASARFAVTSPAVGTFTSVDPVPAGTCIEPGRVLGVVAAPGRDTEVLFEAAQQGAMIRYEVAEHGFVEYGQTIALVELGAPR